MFGYFERVQKKEISNEKIVMSLSYFQSQN